MNVIEINDTLKTLAYITIRFISKNLVHPNEVLNDLRNYSFYMFLQPEEVSSK